MDREAMEMKSLTGLGYREEIEGLPFQLSSEEEESDQSKMNSEECRRCWRLLINPY
jgi:hypothetical protein